MYNEESGTSLTVPVISGVELCHAVCFTVPPHDWKWKWENGLQQHPKTGVSEWGLTWCPHPPGQLQSGYHGLSHTLAWPAEPCVSVKGPYHWAHHPAGSLSSLCPSLQPPQGSCFLPGLFGVLPWEAQQIPRGCGSPGSQIPNALLFPDPPRAKSLASASVYNS